jgi:hypothetical protein
MTIATKVNLNFMSDVFSEKSSAKLGDTQPAINTQKWS